MANPEEIRRGTGIDGESPRDDDDVARLKGFAPARDLQGAIVEGNRVERAIGFVKDRVARRFRDGKARFPVGDQT